MVDEDSHDGAPAGIAPVNRDKRLDPGVIDGEVGARGEDEAEGAPRASDSIGAAASPSPAPRVARSQGGLRAFLAGAIGGAVVAALIAAGDYYLRPASDLAQADANRLTALEANSQRDGSAREAEARREASALGDLTKRIGSLEAASSGAPPAVAATEATERLTAQMKDLRAAAEAGRERTAGLADRIAKLESEASRASADSPALSALGARIDKIEAAQAATKSESRGTAERSAAGDNAAAIAIVATEVRDKLASGAPFGQELAALERLDVGSEDLTALKAVVTGAPTGKALAASFTAVAPKVLDATSQAVRGGAVDRFLAHIRGLVHVHVLNEKAGDDPSALISQIEGALGRGDAAGALAAFSKLPEGARQAADDWASQANARRAADAAVQSIADSAIGRLARDAKP
jgi:hypothetical protein